MWLKFIASTLLLIILCNQSLQKGRRRRQGFNSGSRETCTTPRNVVGICTNIKECPLHLDYLVRNRKEPDTIRYLHEALCRREGSQIITCCPLEKRLNLESNTDCQTPNNVPGECMNIKKCSELVDMLKRRREPGVTEYLKKSLCGFDNKDPLVCCPMDKPSRETDSASSDNRLPGLNVCGISGGDTTSRVVNGRPASLGSWPWMVALGYRSPTKPLEWLCGASLINNRYTITAAHCVTNIGRKTLFVARLGDLNLNDSVEDNASPIDIPVEKIIPHENYNAALHTVDIALIKLKDSVKYTKLIRPICLPETNTFRSDLTDYSPFVIGWGATSYRGPSTTALQEAQIDITDIKSCAKAYANIKGATIDNRVICALSPLGKDACQGDSGGPLILPKQTANFFLIGIVSYGYKCAEPGFPGIYTKVALYTDWIKRNMS